MVIWKVSQDVEKKVINIAKNMDYDRRVLFILKNLGPQRFTSLEHFCGISRSTLSKYLKLHVEQKNIEKKIYKDDDVQEMRYFLTTRGEEKLLEESIGEAEHLFFINELNDNILELSDLVEFYKEIGVDNTIIFQIVDVILKMGEKFFF
ncbi:MAG: winged helix-turn-helix transcriptional regulator, partial [Promethearchaeota archaeon]